MSGLCPLSGAKRTRAKRLAMSANDPKRTLTGWSVTVVVATDLNLGDDGKREPNPGAFENTEGRRHCRNGLFGFIDYRFFGASYLRANRSARVWRVAQDQHDNRCSSAQSDPVRWYCLSLVYRRAARSVRSA